MSSDHGPGMIRTVLIVSAAVFIVGLIIFWFVSGGVAATARTAKNLMNPIDFLFGSGTLGTSIHLPWQLDSITQGPDISGYGDGTSVGGQSLTEERSAIEAQYGPSIGSSNDVRTFGNPSPYVGRVTFTGQNTWESSPAQEYVMLVANANNDAPITLSGWSLQSAVSGARVNIPYGAAFFTLGIVNNVQAVYLEPGTSAIVTTGISPVGTSFRENVCTGYLNELQPFTPTLSSQCPSPYGALPVTADNIRTYGDECIDYVNSLDQCHFPSNVPATLSPACRSFITNTFSYNGCVNVHRNEASFALPSWRVYLGLQTELWRNTHDVIRLLDEKGQTVDVFTY